MKFNVVSAPADILRIAAKSKGTDELSDIRKAQLAFWTKFRDRLVATKQIPSAQSPRPQYWYNISLGKSGIHLSTIFNTFENAMGIRVYISNRIADIALPYLEKHRAAIEAEIGETLEWNPYPDKLDKIIRLSRPADLFRQDQWDEYCDWLVSMTLKFRKAFSPRVKALKTDSLPEDVQ